ncbi:MAG: hypothetical protein JWQ26_2406, partial [Modestobacter sp.]|nr:hypothetical protein [Modestobacter sp.]
MLLPPGAGAVLAGDELDAAELLAAVLLPAVLPAELGAALPEVLPAPADDVVAGALVDPRVPDGVAARELPVGAAADGLAPVGAAA